MSLIKVPNAAPQPGNVTPIPGPEYTGVKEDGYRKELNFREKHRPVVNGPVSAQTGNASGKSFGTKVQ